MPAYAVPLVYDNRAVPDNSRSTRFLENMGRNPGGGPDVVVKYLPWWVENSLFVVKTDDWDFQAALDKAAAANALARAAAAARMQNAIAKAAIAYRFKLTGHLLVEHNTGGTACALAVNDILKSITGREFGANPQWGPRSHERADGQRLGGFR